MSVETKILKTHFWLCDISLLTYVSQALLKLKFLTRLRESWINKSHLVKKETFKLFTTGELRKTTLIKQKQKINSTIKPSADM